MFAEALDRVSLSAPALHPEAVSFPKAGDPAWRRIPESFRQEIEALDAAYAAVDYPLRSAAGFLAFSRSGSRAADEEPYFARRRKLCVSAVSCCAGLDRLDRVIDGIWCVCEETSWVISAHNINPVPGAPTPGEFPLPDPDRPYVDLFAAQTGMILAFISSLLGKELDAVTPMLRQRIRREIDRRVLRPFLRREDFWWMGAVRQDLNNWTPWITANILYCACLLPLSRKKLLAVLEKSLRILDRYLAVIPPDGGCDEGPGYWNMAGGSLADCLEVLEQVSGGALSFWKEEKIRNIMAFPRKTAVGNGWFANFADCDARPFLSGERMQAAGKKTGDAALEALGLRMRGTLTDQIGDTPHLNRLLQLLFHPVSGAPAPFVPEDAWLPDLQWRIVRRGGWTLCCKGGHNGENHNHNDVGSFMLYVDGEPVIVDAGNMAYTAVTFSDRRYTLWNVRSAWHNVPVIGGAEQEAGAAFAASEAEALPDGMALEFAGAYPESAGVLSCRRTFTLREGCLRVEESVSLKAPESVEWVLLLRNPPRIRGNRIAAGPVMFTVPDGFTAEAEERPVDDPRMARSFPGSLWRLRIISPETAGARWTLEVHSKGGKEPC